MPCNPSIAVLPYDCSKSVWSWTPPEMARTIDETYIQMKMLNTGKGPAAAQSPFSRLIRSFTLRRCVRQLKIKRIWPFVKPWLMRFLWKMARLSVLSQPPNQEKAKASNDRNCLRVGKSSSRPRYCQDQITAQLLLTSQSQGILGLEIIVSRQEHLHVSRLFYQLWCDRKSSQEMKHQITLLILHVMRIA